MTEQEILSYFNDRPAPAKTTDLHRIRFLCNELHNPQDALKGRFLHVAGTNGKGSTCAYLDAVLRAGGMRTGLFISPFIHTFEERIQIDGAPVSLAEIEAALPLLQKAEKKLFLKHRETAGHFELITALAFFLFAQHQFMHSAAYRDYAYRIRSHRNSRRHAAKNRCGESRYPKRGHSAGALPTAGRCGDAVHFFRC